MTLAMPVQAGRALATRDSLSAAEKAAVRFAVGDVDTVHYDEGAFDTILCCNTLQYFPDMPGVLAKARAWLQPGGALSSTSHKRPKRCAAEVHSRGTSC
jgi:ubiquinone/menaquinone biosynthesis C-methylase UbiE